MPLCLGFYVLPSSYIAIVHPCRVGAMMGLKLEKWWLQPHHLILPSLGLFPKCHAYHTPVSMSPHIQRRLEFMYEGDLCFCYCWVSVTLLTAQVPSPLHQGTRRQVESKSDLGWGGQNGCELRGKTCAYQRLAFLTQLWWWCRYDTL